MNIKFRTLILQCRRSQEVIEFSPQVSFFHGQISAGKSSIARLIDFCLGGDYERTPALMQELVSVQLAASISKYDVLFEREARGSNQVQVTWRTSDSQGASALVPLDAGPSPIWADHVYTLSDLIFHLSGITPLKVRRNKRDPDSPLVRLSFRDILWYCYLEQDHLDSSFFRLEDPFRGLKSRDAMRFVLGYYTERLNELEIRLEEARDERSGKLEAAKQIRMFLERFGFATASDITGDVEQTQRALEEAKAQRTHLQHAHGHETHFADALRQRLRSMSDCLAREEQTLQDLDARIAEQEALKAELLSSKFKLARMESASSVLSGLKFEVCPACGMKIDQGSQIHEGTCQLCRRTIEGRTESASAPEGEIVRRDLTARIDELTESIERHKKARSSQERAVFSVRKEKAILDQKLSDELRNYDSAFLSGSREVDRNVATLEERLRSLQHLVQIPEAISTLEAEADALKIEEEQIRRKIVEEKKSLRSANQYIREIEDRFLQALLAVGIPGVSPNDQIHLNPTTWMPFIFPGGNESSKWDFFNAGSGGKKTLFNVTYALVLHAVASDHGLPLPTFLIIDTPMKNIGEEVNRAIFEGFYRYLYKLAAGPLRHTQLIIIDKDYIAPPAGIKVNDRFMTPDDEKHPPLIQYYRGP